MKILIEIAILVLIIVLICNYKAKKTITEANAEAVNDMPIVESKPSKMFVNGELAEFLLSEKLADLYPNFSYIEKWDPDSFVLKPYQKVRVHFTIGGYEDVEVFFSLNEHNTPIDVSVEAPSFNKDVVSNTESEQVVQVDVIQEESEEAKWYAANISNIERKAEQAKEMDRCSFIYDENLDGQNMKELVTYIKRVSEYDCSECEKGIRFRLMV